MAITWSEETREFHLLNEPISYVLRVHENGSLGQLALRTCARAWPLYSHLVPGGFDGFANRVGDPVALEYPTTGCGDYPSPRPRGPPRRRLDRPRPCLRESPDPPGQAADPGCRPVPGDLCRRRRRGRHARGHPGRCAERPDGRAPATRSSRDLPVVARSARIRNDGDATVQLEAAMSAVLDLPDPRLGSRPAVRRMGPREPRRRSPPPSRPAGRRQRPRGLEPSAQPVHRPAPRDDNRGRRRGLRLQPGLLGQLHRRGRGRPVTTRRGSASGSARTPSRWQLAPGDVVRHPRGGPGLLRCRASAG